MASDWAHLTLREAEIVVIDCDHRTPQAASSGYPYVTIPNLRDGRIDVGRARRITPADFAEWTRRALPRANDVVLSRRTNPGETAHVPEGLEFALGQNLVLLRASGRVVDPQFLRWLVRGQEWWSEVARHINVGAVFDSLRVVDIPKFTLTIPPLPDQRAIARTLEALDDRIELNQRMNQTLEEIARALFKSWFVAFDPVRAKAEGREPALPPTIADLFPSHFEESELGEIPAGWRVGRLGDVVEPIRDPENPRLSPDVEFLHYSIPAFDAGQAPKREIGRSILSQKWRVPSGTVLLSKLNPDIERVWMADVGLDERAVCSTEFLVLRAREPFSRSYVYSFARSALFRQQIEALVTGTSRSHQRAHSNALLNLKVLLPSLDALEAFERLAGTSLARTLVSRRESRTLSAVRDALLPPLISGGLRLSDAKHILEAASV